MRQNGLQEGTAMTNPLPPLEATTRQAEPPPASPVVRVIDQLRPRRGPSRLLGWAAAFWLGSAVFHLGVWAIDGGSWSGPLSWRKPIVFSLSIGLLLWALGWLLDRLPHRRRLAWTLAVAFVVSSTAEISLIAAQTWRGEASHFNVLEDINSLIFALMGAMVGVMSLVLLVAFVWSLIERPTDPIARSAAFWGFALVIAGLGIGQWIIELGNDFVARFDQVPSAVTYGDAGVVKFPHAIAFHGIQAFALAAAMLSGTGMGAARARLLMRLVVGSYLGVFAFSAIQTGSGRAPADVMVGSAALLGLSAAVLVASLAAIAWFTLQSRPVGGDEPALPVDLVR
jgi:MFS family permease